MSERSVEVSIDGDNVSVQEGATLLDACRKKGVEDPDALLPREPRAGERVPGVCGRARRLAHPRARLLAHGRAGHEGSDG